MSVSLVSDRLEDLRTALWPRIEDAIAEVVPRAGAQGTLEDMAWYHFDTGGKRLRAVIPLALTEAWGQDPAGVVPFGAAVEMLHNATLVHDDLQDGDTHRRGRETVWKRYGVAQSINCGDAMFYWAVMLVQKLDRDPATKCRLTDLLTRCTLSVIAGQVAEFQLKESPAPTQDAYLAMVRGKTSGLFALPIVGAAILAGVADARLEPLTTVGEHLGVVFQVQDDLLDLVGDKGRDQKGTDIAEGKISLPAAHFLATAPAAARAEGDRILRLPREETTPADIARGLELFEEHGSIRYAFELIGRYEAGIRKAAAAIDNPDVQTLLTGLTDVFLAQVRPHVPTR